MIAVVLAQITEADATRAIAMGLAGVSFGVSIPILREFARNTHAYDRLAVRLFTAVHALIVIYVWLTLASHFGDELSWRTPLAILIFTLKTATLLLIRQGQMNRIRRGEQPHRRSSDPV